MKQAAGYIILIALVVALVVTLFVRQKGAEVRHKQDGATILSFSNSLKEISVKLDDARGVISNLEQDIAARTTTLQVMTNDLARTVGGLEQAKADFEAARKANEAELAKRDARIADLEAQNLNLDRRATALTNAIAELNTQISETRRKLTISAGDKTFLEGELKRLMSEKADLEKKFNDLEALRNQVSKLKDEMAVSRRLEWVRKGVFSNSDRKGAEMLMFKPAPAKPAPAKAKYDLNVGSAPMAACGWFRPRPSRPRMLQLAEACGSAAGPTAVALRL